jgi:hypothetical protein
MLTACQLAPPAEPARPLWPFVHPNAKSLIGIDVRQIRQSSLGRYLEEQWMTKLGKALPGMDLLDQVDRLLISSPGSKNADDPAEPPILIVARGRFDLARVRQLLHQQRAKPQIFDSVTVYRPQGKMNKEFAIALIDAQTILAGDSQSIFAAIERLRLPPGEGTNVIFGRAASLDAEYDFWALMLEPGSLGGQWLPMGGLVEGLTGLEAGVSMRNGFSANVSMSTTNEDKAHELKDQLGKLLKLVSKDEAARPEWALIAKRPKLSVQGCRVALSIRIDRTELESSLRSLQARALAKLQVPIPSKPQRQVIRIEGLDEGPRELLIVPNQ